MIIDCNDIEDTKKLAILFSKIVKDHGAFITLRGDIGVGKTAFTRFLLQDFGVQETITSPTFVILNEYHGEGYLPVYHFDLYRLENVGVKSILGELEEYSSGDKLTLVEWADFGEDELPKERLDIKISYNPKKEDSRIFDIQSFGEKADDILKKVSSEYEVKNAASCI